MNNATPVPFSLGAMYWQNPNYGKAEVEEDMRRIKENNFSIIRAFIWWEQIEKREGQFDFEMHDILFDAAAKYGIEIMETLGLYLPYWLQKRLARQGIEDKSRYYCLDRPEVSEPMQRYIEATVSRYKDAPALKIWNVWNEPCKPACHCEHTRARFLTWLKEKYATVDDLKAAWLGEFQVFDTLCPDSLDELDLQWLDDAFHFGKRGRVTPMQYDWNQFSCVNLTQNMKWLADQTKAIDPNHETHSNFLCAIFNPFGNGIDHYEQAKTLDSISMSVHPSHTFYQTEDLDEYPIGQSFAADKIQSVGQATGRDAWIGELQAGTTSFHSRKYTPSADDISHVLWHSVGRGLRGVLFWEWQSWRSSMMEVGEFSLRRCADGGPTERSIAAGEVGKVIVEQSEVLGQVKRPADEVAILLSSATGNLGLLRCHHKHIPWIEHEHYFAAYGCYKALNRANLAVRFVSEAEVRQGALSQFKVLYLPHVECMGPGVAKQIESFVREGGTVWADGRCAHLDEYVYLRHAIPGHGLADVFGCNEADFVASRDGAIMTSTNGETFAGYRHAQYLEPTTGTVTATFANGHAAIVSNAYGKGTAHLVGTYLTLGIQKEGDEATMEYLAGVALDAGVQPKLGMTPNRGFEASVLHGPEHDVIIVTNHSGTATKLTIEAPAKYSSVHCPMDEKGETKFNGQTITRAFDKAKTAVFFCNK